MPRIIGVNYQEIPIGTMIPYGGGVIPSGWLLCDGAAISRTVYSKLFSALRTAWGVGDLSSTFNLPDTRGRTLRFRDGTAGVDPDKTSRTALVSGTWTLASCSTENGNDNIMVTSTANLAPGMSVTGAGIPGNCAVLNILNNTSFQLGNTTGAPQGATATNATVTLTFSNSATANYVGSAQADALQNITGTFPVSPLAGTYSGAFTKGEVFSGNGYNAQPNYQVYFNASLVARTSTETRMKNVAVMAIIKYI